MRSSRFIPPASKGFTLLEVLVSVSVLFLMITILASMFDGVTMLVVLRNKEVDLDSQMRVVFDRMAIDFENIVKRDDVNYYLKSDTAESGAPQNYDLTDSLPMANTNDQIAFYSTVPGYVPTSATAQASFSLVGYRLNTNTYRLERYGRNLLWNGATVTTSTGGSSYGDQPVFLPVTFGTTGQWPDVISSSATDPDYEALGPTMFRFEYHYLLKSGALSTVPWDTTAGHTSVRGLQDVIAIGVDVAAIDSRSAKIVSTSTLGSLTTKLSDFNATTMGTPGSIEASWESVLQGNSVAVPALARPGLRVYHRYFYLSAN